MSLSFPFPTGLIRAIGEEPVTVVAHDGDGEPTVVCVRTTSAFDRAAALVLLEKNPESFVLSDGLRFSPDGHVESHDPARPHYAGELRLSFDVEWVELGPQPRVHVFAHTEQEWEDARQAMAHLFQLGRLSPLSYVESDHTGQGQGVFAQNVDAKPHGPGLVALIREAAYGVQNDLYESPDVGEVDEEEIREDAIRLQDERSDDDDWEEDDDWDEAYADEEDGWEEEERPGERWTEEEEQTETAADEEFIQISQRTTSALARWWKGGSIVKRLMQFRETEHF